MTWWGILIIIVAILMILCFLLSVANFSGERFLERYQSLNNKLTKINITPINFIKSINYRYFKGQIEIIQISRLAGDSYSKGKLFLSTDTLSKSSLASFTIIAHEMGHAYQDKTGKKLKTLSSLRKIGKLLGFLMLPSIIAGGILMIIGNQLFVWGIVLILFGVLIFLLALFIKLRTISIEKDASNHAIKFLSDYFDDEEIKECKSFLNDARLTYWAEFLRLCLGWTAMSKKTKLFN